MSILKHAVQPISQTFIMKGCKLLKNNIEILYIVCQEKKDTIYSAKEIYSPSPKYPADCRSEAKIPIFPS